jgi:hypothetical protein
VRSRPCQFKVEAKLFCGRHERFNSSVCRGAVGRVVAETQVGPVAAWAWLGRLHATGRPRSGRHLVQLVDQLERLQLDRDGSTASVWVFCELQLDRLQEERLQLDRSSSPASLQDERLQLERV